MPFLLDVFRIPADTFQLFIATGVINSRFGALVAAVHTVAVALLGSAAIAGTLRFDARRLVRYAITTAVLTAVILGGLRLTFRTVLAHEFRGADVVYGMTNLLDAAPARVVEAAPATPEQPPTPRAHPRQRHAPRRVHGVPAAVRVPQRAPGAGRIRRRAGDAAGP